ncbi:hypothetical protein FRC11_013031, partial [Ceratobasidium sp. 423]
VWCEGLRLAPDTPFSLLACDEDGAIGNGKYFIKKGVNVVILAEVVARDPVFWGNDLGAWIPFATSARECIDRQYAWQQALVTLAIIFQRFDVVSVDPSNEQLSALKRRDLKVQVTPRKDTPFLLGHCIGAARLPCFACQGNTGSCEGFAQTIVSRAARYGFRAIVETLDTVATNLPKDGPVIIVTASFEGEPVDNAGRFVKALTIETNVKDLGDVSFAVFGAGNHEWARTYQRIPRLIDTTLEKRGAKRLLEHGEGNAGGDSFAESFYDWEEKLWETLSEKYSTKAASSSGTMDAEVQFVSGSTDRATALRQPDAKPGLVIENRLLTAPGAPPKHHIGFVEIGQFVNKRNISTLLEYASDPSTRSDLESMLANFKKGGKKPNSSMLSLLEKYPHVDVPLGVYITSLPPMRLRQYTISSSPLWNPNHVTLTVGVIVQGQFRGVGSNYLGNLRKGDQVLMAVRPSAKAFHPPADPNIPMVLFAAGSGLALFRGFLQE